MEEEKYKYNSKAEYISINKNKVSALQKLHQKNQNTNNYSIHLKYYDPYMRYYLIPPKNYMSQLDQLKNNKEDIFSKGKILTFTSNNQNFYFDAVVESFGEEENIYYCYIVPIKKKYRYRYRNTKKYKSIDLVGNYEVKERSGDLTYIRMKDALDEFSQGYSISQNLENLILGKYDNIQQQNLNYLFNFERYYITKLYNFGYLTKNKIQKIENIFSYELNTIELSEKTNKKIISFIINAILQRRKHKKDKILICTSSNISVDKIALDLMEMNYYTNTMNLLRVYAKNQELIKRDKNLDQITYHKLIKEEIEDENYSKRRNKGDWLIKNSDIIISTCVNSYTDELINYAFPFVIIADADNASENESLIPITLKAQHVTFISYNNNNNNGINMYKRMKELYKESHIIL